MRRQVHSREAHPRLCATLKILAMRQAVVAVVFAAALLSERSSLSVASPTSKTEDDSLERDAFASLLREEGMDNGLDEADPAGAGKPRGQRVVVVASPSLLRTLHDGLYQKRSGGGGGGGNRVGAHNDATQDLMPLPILRRDVMKCMVGRVYRPCWEV